jgi:hypothetical protein
LPSSADNEKTLCNIKINEVLLEVLDSQALSEQSSRGNLLDKEDTQTRAASQELLAEGSNSQDKAKSKALEKTKVYPSSKSSFSEVKN